MWATFRFCINCSLFLKAIIIYITCQQSQARKIIWGGLTPVFISGAIKTENIDQSNLRSVNPFQTFAVLYM